jgi:hypothetical protein
MLASVMLQTWLESDSKQHQGSGPSGAADGVPLVLLLGRALHVAARVAALLQLHEPAGGAAALLGG